MYVHVLNGVLILAHLMHSAHDGGTPLVRGCASRGQGAWSGRRVGFDRGADRDRRAHRPAAVRGLAHRPRDERVSPGQRGRGPRCAHPAVVVATRIH